MTVQLHYTVWQDNSFCQEILQPLYNTTCLLWWVISIGGWMRTKYDGHAVQTCHLGSRKWLLTAISNNGMTIARPQPTYHRNYDHDYNISEIFPHNTRHFPTFPVAQFKNFNECLEYIAIRNLFNSMISHFSKLSYGNVYNLWAEGVTIM